MIDGKDFEEIDEVFLGEEEIDIHVADDEYFSDEDSEKNDSEPKKRERMYCKVRDTMIPYGFPRGSDSFATSNIKSQDINRVRATALYTKPIITTSNTGIS